MKQNLLVIGLGPHAQFCQYRFLEEMARQGAPVHVRLLVELQDRQENIENYLADKTLLPDEIFGLPVEDRNAAQIHPRLLEKLNQLAPKLDGVVLCTEPKAHKKYILWALEHGLDVLTDKPLTAPLLNAQGPVQVWQDFVDIERALSHSRSHITLLTNKRVHPAYEAVYDHVCEFATQYGMPITHIEISEGGGVWHFPLEYQKGENHPHKYGYGVLLHTGFHYVDLLLHYQSINHLIGFKEDAINVHAFCTTPFDVFHQFPQSVYEQILPAEKFTDEFKQVPQQDYKHYGEVDVVSSLQFIKDGAVTTQAGLNILQHTLSSRTQRATPANLYLKLGRLTQNYISLFCGPLLNVRLSFFQPDRLDKEDSDVYVVEVCRNTGLVGGESYHWEEFDDKVVAPDGQFASLNNDSKRMLFKQWISGTCPEKTDFALHKRSVQLTARLFEEIFARRKERFGK